MKFSHGAGLAGGLCSLLLFTRPSPAMVLDGSTDPDYGPVIIDQGIASSFGNNTLGQIDRANGSELDNCFGTIINGTLYLLLGGNLKSDFTKLEVFFDCLPGGQGKLRGDNAAVDANGLNRMGDDGIHTNGLSFDPGFTADFWISVGGGGTPYELQAHYAQLLSGGGGIGYYLGSTGAGSDGTLTGGTNPFGLRATINNVNTAGVPAAYAILGQTHCYASSGHGVTNGVELAIPLPALSNPSGGIKICAFINSPAHDFLSNQALYGLLDMSKFYFPSPYLDLVGDPRAVDFGALGMPGIPNQYFTLFVDCPPGALEFAVSSLEVSEPPGSQTKQLRIPVRRSGGVCGPVSIGYLTVDGTAQDGPDYRGATSTVSFPHEIPITNSFFISICPDSEVEGSETFSVTLFDPTGGAVLGSPTTLIITIRDEDEDLDGLYDDWEQIHFGDLAQLAQGDFDQDGLNNYLEQCAGTDPADADSGFKSAFRLTSQGLTLNWPSAAGRTYAIECKAGSAESYLPLISGLAATPPTNTYLAPSSAAGCCYRIKLESGCP